MILRTASIQSRPKNLLDITRKTSGPEGKPFAPSPGILWPIIDKRHKGTLTPRDYAIYRTAYIKEMGRSFKANRAAWLELLNKDEVTLGCYCHKPADACHCHRITLAWLLLQVGLSEGITVRYEGEILASLRVAIVGARHHPHILQWVSAVVASLPAGAIVVSGHAVGVDDVAEDRAEQAGCQVVSLPCSGKMWRTYDNQAGMIRNRWIADACDVVVALPWAESPGTLGMIGIAKEAGRAVYVVRQEDDLAGLGGFFRSIQSTATQARFLF